MRFAPASRCADSAPPINIQAVGMKLVRAKGNRGDQAGDVSFVAMGLGSKNQPDLPSRSSA